jgi:hypothetical protein
MRNSEDDSLTFFLYIFCMKQEKGNFLIEQIVKFMGKEDCSRMEDTTENKQNKQKGNTEETEYEEKRIAIRKK